MHHQRGFYQSCADGDLPRIVQVNDFRRAAAGQDFREHVQTDEGRYYTAWVDGREVGDVVEGSAEDEIVCSGVDGPG